MSFDPIGLLHFKRVLDSFSFVLQGPQSVLEHSQLGYVTLLLSLHQQMHLVIDLQDSVNE